MRISTDQARIYLSSAGFTGQPLEYALQIMGCESGYETEAHNTSGEDSRGLMQINVSSNANPQFANYNLFDPLINCQVAFQIFKNAGNNFKDWSCAQKLGLIYPVSNDEDLKKNSMPFLSSEQLSELYQLILNVKNDLNKLLSFYEEKILKG